MASLTPQHKSGELTGEAMNEGLVNGTMTLIPCLGALYLAMQRPGFRKVTNWQSRTAMVIMPALFVFSLSGEKKMEHRMKQLAEETEHTLRSVEWADRQARLEKYQSNEEERERRRDLYRHSVMQSGVSIVPQLRTHHEIANYVQSNPIKVLLGVGVPAVAAVFYGRSGKPHLSMQMKILHTRVLGQASVLVTLLSVMTLKHFMDQQGQFMTQDDVERRIDEMEEARLKMMERLDFQAARTTMAASPMKYKKLEE
mmetsp:Transcript_20078/g.56945  ORF Transcript_20078/g.56945 Transcript_20078/m.56945 type:complete len:255 (-) Transcript_20078:253-1017(-)|eukprot:CAMPEP_0119570128 /NCGR_PEP_ID=MMETSP1352-20130426/43453_1 /TAXON_ID=265584 /ORGANISM="Stauroneis constricta, Strain CCMP1120" /LENGTH=254 /DNA_ID=CAMNT_0007619793 /DNA_START=205 /DNA_END=969 /DNA_ORIENTATION=-